MSMAWEVLPGNAISHFLKLGTGHNLVVLPSATSPIVYGIPHLLQPGAGGSLQSHFPIVEVILPGSATSCLLKPGTEHGLGTTTR